jgi:hypothetical protein
MNDKIDFVILWVDGNDIEWRKEKDKYDPSSHKKSVEEVRYRDWDNLQYWFRGVEKFAPWVNKIHFVTWGHTPAWLNVNHPKVNVVKHEEYIPLDFLPTFNSSVIELNLHRIKGLSDKFVYFNDDMFLLQTVKISDFFINGLPCDTVGLEVITAKDMFAYFLFNNVSVINNHFDKKFVIRNNKLKWFSAKNGIRLLCKTLALYPWERFPGFQDPHLPLAFNKETLEEVWKEEQALLNETCSHKFRDRRDVTGWLFRYWRLAKGEFINKEYNMGKYYNVTNDSESNKRAYNAVSMPKHKIICINDTETVQNFEHEKVLLKEAFEKILPNKSSFEL